MSPQPYLNSGSDSLGKKAHEQISTRHADVADTDIHVYVIAKICMCLERAAYL